MTFSPLSDAKIKGMDEEQTFSAVNRVTPLSKYLAMVLFIVMPFIGGYIGYTYAPEKVVEVEKIVYKDESGESLNTISNQATSTEKLDFSQQTGAASEINYLSEEKILSIAQKVIIQDLKTQINLECLNIQKEDEGDDRIYHTKRVFSDVCPGDVTSAPAIPSIKISKIDGSVSVMSLDGVYRPL